MTTERNFDVYLWFITAKGGALDGGPQCLMSNLRNGYVACPLATHVPCRL